MIPPSIESSTRQHWYAHPAALWVAFALAHVWVAWLNFSAPNEPLGDVQGIYLEWVKYAVDGVAVVGIQQNWVYPIAALIPLFIAAVPGLAVFPESWIVMVSLLDALAFYFLISGWRRPVPRFRAAWWWIAFVLCLGPITLGRLDSVAAPMAVMGMVFLLTRPRIASVILTVATWIKVWPAAVLLSAAVVLRSRWRVVVVAVVTSAVIVIITVLLGGATHILSFLTEQTDRGIQIESPIATPFVWLSVVKAPGYHLYFDMNLLTYQVRGRGVLTVAAWSNVALAIAVIVTIVLGGIGVWRGVDGRALLAPVTLSLVMSLIVFNKVGSPQYMTWVIAPVVLGLVVNRTRFLPVAVMTLVMALMTQVFYPFYYDHVVGRQPIMVAVLTVRNVLEVVVLLMALSVLAATTRARLAAGATGRRQRLTR